MLIASLIIGGLVTWVLGAYVTGRIANWYTPSDDGWHHQSDTSKGWTLLALWPLLLAIFVVHYTSTHVADALTPANRLARFIGSTSSPPTTSSPDQGASETPTP
jgi:hypothetical protein